MLFRQPPGGLALWLKWQRIYGEGGLYHLCRASQEKIGDSLKTAYGAGAVNPN